MNKPTHPKPPRSLDPTLIKRPVVQQTRAKPVAPPVYRPQPTPKVLQRKAAQRSQAPEISRPGTATPPPHSAQVPRKPVPAASLPLNRQPAPRIPTTNAASLHQRLVLQRKLKAGSNDAVIPIEQTIGNTETNQYTKTNGNKEINEAVITDRALRKRVYTLVQMNNGSSRYTSTVSVNLESKSVKNASGIPVVWEPGPEFKPVQISCEYDLVGAAHGSGNSSVATPHVKIGIKPKNGNYYYPFGNRVVALTQQEVVAILSNADADWILPWVKASVERGMAGRNVNKNIQSSDWSIK